VTGTSVAPSVGSNARSLACVSAVGVKENLHIVYCAQRARRGTARPSGVEFSHYPRQVHCSAVKPLRGEERHALLSRAEPCMRGAVWGGGFVLGLDHAQFALWGTTRSTPHRLSALFAAYAERRSGYSAASATVLATIAPQGLQYR